MLNPHALAARGQSSAPRPPRVLTPAQLSGTTAVGDTLSIVPTTWADALTTTHVLTRNGAVISGTNDVATYVLSTADVGALIAVRSTATNFGGAATDTTSDVGPVTASVTPPQVLGFTYDATGQGALSEGVYTAQTVATITGMLPGQTSLIVSNSDGLFLTDGATAVQITGTVDWAARLEHTITARVVDALGGTIGEIVIPFVVIQGVRLIERYVAPTAQGAGTGVSMANAAAIGALNSMIASTLADGTVYLRADLGAYNRTTYLSITQGAQVGSIVLVQGIGADGVTLTDVIFNGNRDVWSLPVDPEQTTDVSLFSNKGSFPIFRLDTGAKRLTFRNIDARHCQFGWRAASTSTIPGITIEDCKGLNMTRFFEADAGDVVTLKLIRCVVTGYSKGVLRVRNNSNDILCEDGHYNSGRQKGEPIAFGVSADGTAHDITVRSTNPATPLIIENHHDELGTGGYWNGDSISLEGAVYNVLIQDVWCRGNTDSGCDVKAGNVTFLRVKNTDCKRNFRLWGRGALNPAVNDHTLIDCISADPHVRGGTSGLIPTHIGSYNAADILLEDFTATDSDVTARCYDSESSGDVYRWKGTAAAGTYTGLGTLKDFPAGVIEYDPLNAADVTPPTFSPTSASVNEDVFYSQQLTPSEGAVFRKLSGEIALSVTRDGLLTANAQDFEALPSATLNAVIRVIDQARNHTDVTYALTILDVAGDTGGSVAETTTHGWRFNATEAGSVRQTISGAENKKATKAITGDSQVRSTTAAFPPLVSRAYFEMVATNVITPANYGLGLANRSSDITTRIGLNNHSVGYFADGSVALNGVTIATLPTYTSGAVIGFAAFVGEWTGVYSDVPLVRARKLRIYKNGTEVTTAPGLDISALVDPLYASASMGTAGEVVDCRSVSSEWTGTPPAGHVAWGLVKKRAVTGAGARYIVPNGTGSGSSWANAAPLSALNGLITSVKSGSTTNPHIFIQGDAGSYTQITPIALTNGGASSGNPVTIIAVSQDMIPHPAHINGNRTSWILPSDPTTATPNSDGFGGSDLFQLQTGASNLKFSHIRSARHLAAFYLDVGAKAAITIEDCTFYNNRRGIMEQISAINNDGSEDSSVGGYAGTSCDGVTVRRCHGTGHSKPAFHQRSRTINTLIEDCHWNSGLQQDDAWPTGCKWSEQARDGTAQRVWCFNMKEAVDPNWTQGDGFEANNGTPRVNFIDCVSYGAGDAAFDTKSDGGSVIGCLGHYDRNSFRLWGDGHVCDASVSWFPSTRHIYTVGQDTQPNRTEVSALTTVGTKTLAFHIEGAHIVARMLDGEYYAAANEAAVASTSPAALSTMPQNIPDSNVNRRIFFSTVADVTPPTITSPNSASVVEGSPLAQVLTPSNGSTWEFDASESTTASYTQNNGYFRTADFEIVNPFLATPTLRMLGDRATVIGDHGKTVKICARDAAGNLSSPQTFTLGVVAIAANFPDIIDVTRSHNNTNSTTANILLPATVAAGDLLVAILLTDGVPTITWDQATAGTWVLKVMQTGSASANKLAMYTKVAVGNEDGLTLHVGLSASEAVAAMVLRIGHTTGEIEVISGANSDSTSHNPVAISPTWGSDKNLFIGMVGHDDGSDSYSGFPASPWTTITEERANVSTGVGLAGSWYQLQSNTADCPAFTLSAAEESIRLSIAVRGV